LQVTLPAIDFGDASAGSAGTQTGQLTASGANVTVSSATISSENFQLGGLSLPFTIPAGHSVPFTVTFVPRDSITSSAIISFGSDAKNSFTRGSCCSPRAPASSGQRSAIVEGEYFQIYRRDTTYIVATDQAGRTRRSIKLWIQIQNSRILRWLQAINTIT
jgi:hypothetical protein